MIDILMEELVQTIQSWERVHNAVFEQMWSDATREFRVVWCRKVGGRWLPVGTSDADDRVHGLVMRLNLIAADRDVVIHHLARDMPSGAFRLWGSCISECRRVRLVFDPVPAAPCIAGQ